MENDWLCHSHTRQTYIYTFPFSTFEMTKAAETFFALPELLACLATYLSRNDLIHPLAKINRSTNSFCNAILWNTLNLLDSSLLPRLRASPNGQQALGYNAYYVRDISWRPAFSLYYFSAVWTYLNTTPLSPGLLSIPTDALGHEGWGNMRCQTLTSFIPLPPLRQLNRLRACMTHFPGEGLPPDLPLNNPCNLLHQTMWLVRLNTATLTYLKLSKLDLSFAPIVRDISRTISQLRYLQTLQLGTQSNYSLTRQALESFFFSCPISLVHFKVTNKIHGPRIYLSLNPVAGDWDYGHGPLVLRDEPLLRLKSLALPLIPRELMATVYRSLLEHCPALETLELPHLEQLSDDMMFVIASLSDLCPHISDLTFPEDCHAEHLMTVLDSLPAQQLRSLHCRGIDDQNPKPMIATWTLHSTTLKRIELTGCVCVKSTVIQAALTTCRSLQVFKAIGHGDLSKICLKIGHAIEYPWVCAKIRELEIAVWVTHDGEYPTYLRDQSKATWTDTNHQHWKDLGKFYTQIGLLTQLEVLELKSLGLRHPVASISSYSRPSFGTCFPGLLALDDPTSGKIGYLSKLSGLTKLRELRGSFVWSNLDIVLESERWSGLSTTCRLLRWRRLKIIIIAEYFFHCRRDDRRSRCGDNSSCAS